MSTFVRIWAIGRNSFLETIRDRVLYVLLAFAILMIGSAELLSLLTVGSQEKIFKDLGLASIAVFGVMIAVFVGVGTVSKEIEKRTIHSLLARPVHRFEFILGKYFGLFLTILVNTTVMSLWFYLVLAFKGFLDRRLVEAIAMIILELGIRIAGEAEGHRGGGAGVDAVLVQKVSEGGQQDLLADRPVRVHPAGKMLCTVFYYLLPNLENFNIKAEVVHGLPVPTGWYSAAVLYAVAYTGSVLLAAVILFRRRDLA